MNNKAQLILFVTSIFCGLYCYADSVDSDAKFNYSTYTGEQYLNLNKDSKAMYLLGFFDGVVYNTKYDDDMGISMIKCIRSKVKSSNQFIAIVDKYIKSKPEYWSADSGVLIKLSWIDLCKNNIKVEE